MTTYRNANPDASPYVLVTSREIPMALQKGITPGDVLLTALAHAEADEAPIKVYNDGTHVCTVTVG